MTDQVHPTICDHPSDRLRPAPVMAWSICGKCGRVLSDKELFELKKVL